MEEEQLCREIWTRWVPKRVSPPSSRGSCCGRSSGSATRHRPTGTEIGAGTTPFSAPFWTTPCWIPACSPAEEGERLHGVLVRLRSCGEVAHRYHRGELTDHELEEDYHGETACVDDAPYNLVRGAVIRFCRGPPGPHPLPAPA